VVQRNEQVGEPDLAAIGAALAEAARAKILLALVGGRSLAASHLATEAGVSPPTASHHLSRLCDVGLITATARGRHRYYAIADTRVAELIEAAARIAPLQPVTSLRQGTRAHAVRYARRCYDHLAGRLGVALADALCRDGSLDVRPDPVVYRVTGAAYERSRISASTPRRLRPLAAAWTGLSSVTTSPDRWGGG
jgi:DNA-binding transcriptional ArsR family regulator